jgi:hypothetical protein
MVGPEEVVTRAQELARKAIREKVLESYRNGQGAGPRKSYAPKRAWRK